MSRDDCLRLLEQAAELGARSVTFSGGEPLGWPPLPDAVAVAVRRNLETTIYTSGNTPDFLSKAGEMHRLGVKRLVFSVFGGNPATHERVTRVAGSFEVTRRAMYAANHIGLATELHFVPMSTNYRELRDVASLAVRCGASVVSLLRLVPQGRAALLPGRVLNRLQNLELRDIIKELRGSRLAIRTGSPYNFLMLKDKPECCAAIDRLIIGPDLSIFPCDAFKRISSATLVGTDHQSNLHSCSLAECWSASPYLNAVRTYLTTDFGEPCASCRHLERCHSGCLAQKTLAQGALKKGPDPDCLRSTAMGESK
jgi:radical SAM protein with 4Fe4S-binding SPASM domain